MLDITYPLFGGAVFLTTMCAACLWGQMSQLRRRIVVLEARPLVMPTAPALAPPPDPQPPVQHMEIYIPPPPSIPYPLPSAPVATTLGAYYHDDRMRTAVI